MDIDAITADVCNSFKNKPVVKKFNEQCMSTVM